MPQVIPTVAVPSQTLAATLGGQLAQINLYSKTTGYFVDLYVNGSRIIGGVLALNQTLIVRDEYLGFEGDLIIADTQGSSDPVYTGMGSRYQLAYLTADEVTAALANFAMEASPSFFVLDESQLDGPDVLSA